MNKFSKITLGLVLFGALAANAQNVGINTSTPDVSAALDVKSTTQGLLIPRMTKAQREAINMVGGVSTPATGLMVYQIDNGPGFYFYNGTAWTTLSTGGPQLANGTEPGQVYLTGTASPFAPQNPVSLTGAITVNASGVTTLSDASVTTAKIKATGSASGATFLRGDGVWAGSDIASNPTIYAVKKNSSIALTSTGLFPAGFKAVNFVAVERTVGNGALFSDTDNSYTIATHGTYRIGYTFKYGTGIQGELMQNNQGLGIVRHRTGVSTMIDSRQFSGATLGSLSMTISENSINSIYTLQAGDRIYFGLTGSSALDATILSASSANFFIYKISN